MHHVVEDVNVVFVSTSDLFGARTAALLFGVGGVELLLAYRLSFGRRLIDVNHVTRVEGYLMLVGLLGKRSWSSVWYNMAPR